jgi:hypothetical protein
MSGMNERQVIRVFRPKSRQRVQTKAVNCLSV